jgi:hypothetical protein
MVKKNTTMKSSWMSVAKVSVLIAVFAVALIVFVKLL